MLYAVWLYIWPLLLLCAVFGAVADERLRRLGGSLNNLWQRGTFGSVVPCPRSSCTTSQRAFHTPTAARQCADKTLTVHLKRYSIQARSSHLSDARNHSELDRLVSHDLHAMRVVSRLRRGWCDTVSAYGPAHNQRPDERVWQLGDNAHSIG